jgi:hypothetical protein
MMMPGEDARRSTNCTNRLRVVRTGFHLYREQVSLEFSDLAENTANRLAFWLSSAQQ